MEDCLFEVLLPTMNGMNRATDENSDFHWSNYKNIRLKQEKNR